MTLAAAEDRVLVVDDEQNIRSMIRVCLEQVGREVREAGSAEAALAALASGPADVASTADQLARLPL